MAAVRILAAGSLLLAWAGCFSPEFPDGAVACSNGACPPGMSCGADGRCYRQPPGPGIDAGPRGADAAPSGPDGGGNGTAACGNTTLLADDFSQDRIAERWAGSYGVYAVSDGVASFPIQGADWSALDSSHAYDLAESSVAVRIVSLSLADAQSYAYLGVTHARPGPDNDDTLRFTAAGNTLVAEIKTGGGTISFANTDYDPDLHKWWRIREAAGRVYWEHSADGNDWTVMTEQATPFDVTYVHPHIGAGTDVAETAGLVVFDDFNGGTPEGAYCAAASLRDTFDDGAAEVPWAWRWQNGDCVMTGSGRAVLQFGGAGDADCGVIARSAYDLTGSSVSIEVPQPIGDELGDPGYLHFGVETPGGEAAVWELWDGALHAIAYVGGGDDAVDVAFDPVAHRYWRIRETGGQLEWQTSPDGAAWTTQRSAALLLPITRVMPLFGAGMTAPPQARDAAYDALNGAP